MSAFENNLSGIAGEIRASLTSEQYDLGGYTEQRARDLILGAFSQPLDAPTEMIRFTFVVGGGKLVRSRYSDDLPKWIANALRDIGYVEDRSAALSFDSQGSFKQQHDTGQNLKTISVFPRVSCADVKPSSCDNTNQPIIDVKSPEYIVTACELSTLKEIYSSKTQTWRQRKKLLKILQDSSEIFKALEAKLVRGELLSPHEQAMYDSNSGHDDEKITWLQNEIKAMVEGGILSASEKDELSKSISANIASMEEEIAKATEEGKLKRVEKLIEKKQVLEGKKQSVDRITPIIIRLKHAEDIVKLRVKLLSLQALEDKGRSMSLTLADLKQIEEKSEIEQQISQLEVSSRGWFEDEDDFASKCAAEQREAAAKYAAKVKAAEKKKATAQKGVVGRGAGGSAMSSWSSVPQKKKPSSSVPMKKTSSSGYAAAFGGDSDSD